MREKDRGRKSSGGGGSFGQQGRKRDGAEVEGTDESVTP